MKCWKCNQGELEVVKKDGKNYARCDKCGAIFTADNLSNRPPQPQPQSPQLSDSNENGDDEDDGYSMGKIATVTGWVLCALFLMCGLGAGGISLFVFLVAAILISPVFRNRVYLSGKVWIPLVVILFIAGMAMAPQTDTEPKRVAEKQETSTPAKKQVKASVKNQSKKDDKEKEAAKESAEKEEQEQAAQEQAEREEQERIAQEEAAAQAEQERIAQEQAEQERIAQEQAAQAAQERIAQEQAAAQAEQERIAQEQAAAQAEQERIAQEQAAAQQAEQERIAQEQAAQTSYVWLSATGNKYHSIPNCGRMNPDNARQVTLAEAQQLGMEACKNCH